MRLIIILLLFILSCNNKKQEVYEISDTNEQFTLKTSYNSTTTVSDNNYLNKADNKILINPASKTIFYYAMIHTFNSKELEDANIKLQEAFKNPTQLFIDNDNRWNEYIKK